MSNEDSYELECADDNPKTVKRLIEFNSRSYVVEICNKHKDLPEFQGKQIAKTSPLDLKKTKPIPKVKRHLEE